MPPNGGDRHRGPGLGLRRGDRLSARGHRQHRPYAIEYGRIIFLGAITSTGYSAIVRADGNTGYSTAMWIIPICVSIVLCWLFIIVLQLGVSGAALATVSGQTISTGMSVHFFFFRKNRSYHIKASHFKPDWPIIAEVLMIGLPSLIKNSARA
ncbi:polysaccharide biosynthesis C-terminal domain-containing protein [Sorangium sp. So ce429]